MCVQSAEAVQYPDCISAELYDHANECPVYDTKQSDGETPVITEFGGMRSIYSLPLLPVPPMPEVVAQHTVLSMGQIEPFVI